MLSHLHLTQRIAHFHLPTSDTGPKTISGFALCASLFSKAGTIIIPMGGWSSLASIMRAMSIIRISFWSLAAKNRVMKKSSLLFYLLLTIGYLISGHALATEPDFLSTIPKSHYRNQPDRYAFNFVQHKTSYYTHENSSNPLGLTEARHYLVSINSKLGIDYYNTIDLSTSGDDSLCYFKLRILDENGKEVRRFKLSDMQVKSFGGEKLFQLAIEELKVGYYVEYLYARETSNYYFRPMLASAVPIDECILKLSYPRSQTYKYKVYNSKATSETADSNGFTFVTITDKMVEPYISEDDAPEYKTKPFVFIAINSWKAASLENLCNWTNIVNRSFAPLFTPNDEKTNEFVKYLSKSMDLLELSKEDQIRFIDGYIRKSVRISSGNDVTDPMAIRQLFVTSRVNQATAYRALCQYFNALAIDYHLVLTCNRHSQKFDYDFPHLSYVTEAALFFPEYNKYLSITDSDGEYGRIPEQMQGQEALKLKPIFEGKAAAVQLKRIIVPILDYKTDSDSLLVDISLNKDTLVADYRLVAVPRSTPKKNWDFLQGEFESGTKFNVIATFLDRYHGEVTSFNKQPFTKLASKNKLTQSFISPEENSVFKMSLKSADLVKQINGRLLIRYGQLIAKQSSATKESTRKLPAEVISGKSYVRTLKLNIPTGYKVVNPEQLSDNYTCADGKIKFVTTARVEGQVLVIENHEVYDKPNLTAQEYQCFQDVLNAAVRFTKQFIVLEPVQ